MRRRLPLVAFLALIAATIAAFFITQHLKVTTPLITGMTGPIPAAINPVAGITCYDTASHENLDHRTTVVAFYLLHRSDTVDVYVSSASGARVATLATDRFMSRSHKVPTPFTWNGREQSGSVAPDGTYYIRVHLIQQKRTITIGTDSAPLPVRVNTRSRCP